MEPFVTLTSVAAPLLKANIDTDVIIRIERMFEVDKDSLGPFAFEAWRYRPDGSKDPSFVLNQPPFDAARILLVGKNFGCGSSRESAVWALKGLGIRAIIGPSFGEIFFGNCFQNGVLPLVLPEPTVQQIAAGVRADPLGTPVTVDLVNCEVIVAGAARHAFAIEPLRREGLLRGLDAIGLTKLRDADIAAFQRRDRAERGWAWDPVLAARAPEPS